MPKFIFILFLAINFIGFSQEKVTISGYITDGSTGENVIGAKIYIPSIKQGAVTNTYGFYSLTVEAGKYLFEFKATGLDSKSTEIELTKDLSYNLELTSNLQKIDEIEVNAKKNENTNSSKIGQIELEIDEIKALPAFMGEVDIIKAIQTLPGVSSVSEGGQGFYVRGGGPDQNLVLLDEAIVYNAAHLFGFFSVFNPDAVKSVNLIKGGMPANFGGRMSSVLEVNMNEGNMKKFKVTGGIGLISSRLTVEGPLKKDRGSFMISGRRTYIDLIMKMAIPKSSDFAGTTYFFYDFNVKMNYKLSDKDRIFLSGYYGKDIFNFGNKEDDFGVKMPWGNGITSLRWNHLFNNKLFMNVTSTFTDYRFSFGSEQDGFQFKMASGIQDLGGKVDFSYFPNSRHQIKWGVDYIYHRYTPTSVSASMDSVIFDTGIPQILRAHEAAIYVSDEYDINENFRINAGLRYSTYTFTGPFIRYVKGNLSQADSQIKYEKNDLIKFYHGLEPRLTMRYLLPDHSSIKAGFNYNYQYVHLASFSAVSMPMDIWYPATDITKPQQGWQVSTGYFRNFFDDKYEASVEVYYKDMRNLVEFKEGTLPGDDLNDNTDNYFAFGKGWSYGVELFFKKSVGKFTGWVGYTWAKTERKFADLNDGKTFPAKYDRRHDLSLTANYKLNDHWQFGAAFIFATGNTLTLPSSWYTMNQQLYFHYGERNSTRMAPYHRLDLSATWYDSPTKIKKDKVTGEYIHFKKRFRNNIAISIYNVYNRANPFFLYVDQDGGFLNGDFKISVKQVSLFPIIPGVTWNFEF